MAEAKAHGKILVIDDHYGVASEDFYSSIEFERDFGALPFKFVFADARDESGRYTVEMASQAVEKHDPDGVLLDIMFGKGQEGRLGLAILKELTRKFPAVPVVMMTVLTRNEAWEECARLGAVDYLPKPLDSWLLRVTLDRYMGDGPGDWVVGQNGLFVNALNLVAKAAKGGITPIMIMGETGAGKGSLARFAHRHGPRAGKPFDLIDLLDIPVDRQATDLFGYSKGAYTGAVGEERGRFLKADGGVVFLDEIGDIDSRTQSHLLTVLDRGEIARLGDGKKSRVDVQIVAATNADLALKIKNKDFRQALWERINGMQVTLPALAQRREDIPLLVRHHLRCQAIERGIKRGEPIPIPELPVNIEATLRDFPWSGNVRQLGHYARKVFDLAGDEAPKEHHFSDALPPRPEILSDNPGAASVIPLGQPSTGGVEASDRLQLLRLEELALLYAALEKTRDPVGGTTNRAKAAALLKGKPKCNTNEFDRWVKTLWDELTPENRNLAVQRFPELLAVLKDAAGN